MQRVKGLQKDYDMWMQDELNDYSLPVDKSKSGVNKLDKQIEKIEKKIVPNHQVQKLKASPVKHAKMSSDFLQYWGQLPLKIIGRILGWLKLGEVITLSRTCKDMHTSLTSHEIWTYLFTRLDVQSSITQLKGIDARQMYKYSLYTKKIGDLYNTGYCYQNEDAPIAQLPKNIVDFAHIQNVKMKELLENELKLEEFCCDNLKLSLDQEANEAYLWLSYESSKTKELKTPAQTEVPPPQVLRVFSYEENETIQNAFFLGEYFLVVVLRKVSETPSQEESKQNIEQSHDHAQNHHSSFVIYNLEDELRSLLYDEEEENSQDPVPVTCDFYTKSGANESVLSQQDTRVHTIVLGNDLKIEVKALSEEEIIFLTTHTKTPAAVVLDTKSHRSYLKTFELENPLKNVISSRKYRQSDHVILYVADEKDNILSVRINETSSPEINYLVKQKEESDNPSKEANTPERFVEFMKQYHYGHYQHRVGEVDITGEYLILFNGEVFTFIDIDKQKTGEFPSPVAVSNWTVYENKLCLLRSDRLQQIAVSEFSFADDQGPSMTETVSASIPETTEKYHYRWIDTNPQYRWIIMNPSFTVIINATSRTLKSSSDLCLMIGSTQWLLYCLKSPTKWHSREILLDRFLEEKLEKWEIPLNLKQENVLAKFEGEKLLIKGDIYNIFFDFLAKSGNLGNWPIYKKITLGEVFDVGSESLEKDKKVYKIDFANHRELVENRNQNEKKLGSYNKWKKKEGDNDDEKEEKSSKRISPNKGKKYFKNVRQDSRQRKTDI